MVVRAHADASLACRREYYSNRAEDHARVLGVNEQYQAVAGSYQNPGLT